MHSLLSVVLSGFPPRLSNQHVTKTVQNFKADWLQPQTNFLINEKNCNNK